MAIKRKPVTLSVNGAEYLELDARARESSLTTPAYIRTLCGFEAWISRGRENQDRAHSAVRKKVMALDRLCVTIVVTTAEHAALSVLATAAGISIPQYVRTRCGFEVRWTSQPNTDQRDREEEDAWQRLQRLGLDPQDYFASEN